MDIQFQLVVIEIILKLPRETLAHIFMVSLSQTMGDKELKILSLIGIARDKLISK